MGFDQDIWFISFGVFDLLISHTKKFPVRLVTKFPLVSHNAYPWIKQKLHMIVYIGTAKDKQKRINDF